MLKESACSFFCQACGVDFFQSLYYIERIDSVMKRGRQMHYVEAKSLLTKWNGINIYRGCTHGCIYCDSRSRCYHIEHPFEDIEVKKNAPELLEMILRSRRKKCMISTGSR